MSNAGQRGMRAAPPGDRSGRERWRSFLTIVARNAAFHRELNPSEPQE